MSYFDFLEENKDILYEKFSKIKKNIVLEFDLMKYMNIDITFKKNDIDVIEIFNFLNSDEIELFKYEIDKKEWTPIVYYYKNFIIDKTGGSLIHSYNIPLVYQIWERLLSIENLYNNLIISNNEGTFIPVGINPFCRIHKYKNNDFILPHFDPIYKVDNYTSMKGALLYFTDNIYSPLSFLDCKELMDINESYKYIENNNKCNLLLDIFPEKGKLVIFDSNLMHCIKKVINEDRIILFVEIMYKNKNSK
jgi:hypothetical protein